MRNRIALSLCALVFSAVFTPAPAFCDGKPDDLFFNPPRSARPYVWWHWMDGNVSLDGIRKDLFWMDGIGIGGIHQFDAGGRNMGSMVKEKLNYMTPGWKQAFRSAISLADSLGFEMSIASCPGWSSTGGPWVKPEDGMKKLVWRTSDVDGGEVDVILPEPFTTVGLWQDIKRSDNVEDVPKHYEEVAVVAVKIPDSVIRFENAPVDRSADQNGKWIQYHFSEPVAIQSATVVSAPKRNRYYAVPAESGLTLQSSDDGVTFKDVCVIPDGVIPSMTVSFPVVNAEYFRLRIDNRAVTEFTVSPELKINHSEEKAGFCAPNDFMEFGTPEDNNPVNLSDVIDLTDKMDEEGHLRCALPSGRWRVFRFGASLTGKKNHPAASNATGLEVDKLSSSAWTSYFRHYLDMYKEASGGQLGSRGIQYILTDSYEAEQMTWTSTMKQEFVDRNGYQLANWLPALTGVIVGSTQESERFLWDWRNTIGDLFKENYDRLNVILDEYGMKGRYTESHENGHVFVGDGMDLKMTAAVPMSAIWMDENSLSGSKIPMACADIKESSSVAHVFGQNIAAAESFTVNGMNGRAYTYYPEKIKRTADIALSCGLNRFVIHESAHQPSDSLVPGTGLFQYGQWFNRHETWAEFAKPWMDYLARSCYLLQQGHYVADVLYYYGEDNSVTGLFGHEMPEIPDGYAFDFINPKGLMEAVSVRDGKLVTESGMTYRILVLGPNCKNMSDRVLSRISQLVKDGAMICGTIPQTPASLTDDIKSFNSTVQDIWRNGRNNVFNCSLEEALRRIGVSPDFTADSDSISYIHRKLDDKDVYWVRNFSGKDKNLHIQFRDSEKGNPSVWNPETGLKESIPNVDGNEINLKMSEDDATFVVFSNNDDSPKPGKLSESLVTTLTRPWTVRFQEGRGAPESAVFDTLKSLTTSSDPGIRYFSGIASYESSFRLSGKDLKNADSFEIDLGSVKNVAEISVNGQNLGIVWKSPFRIVVDKETLKKGENQIRIRVADLWVNRIIGDKQDGAVKVTYTPVDFYKKDSPLLPSGLLGPVELYRCESR